MQRLRIAYPAMARLFLLGLLFTADPRAIRAQPSAPPALALQGVAWEKLRYQAANWAVNLRAAVQLDTLGAAEATAALLVSPQGTPVKAAVPEVLHLSLEMVMDRVFNPPVSITNVVWFNPLDAQVLGRYRLRRGKDDFEKIYRFTAQGVFRRHREPRNAAEAKRGPHQWTDAGINFYPYDLAQLGCCAVADRLLLLYVASAAAELRANQTLALCVFGKRQLHRVELQPDGKKTLAVDYVATQSQSGIHRQGQVEALRIKLVAQPIVTNQDQPENFSFLGLHKNIVIFLDPESDLPVQISGAMSKIGAGDLKLREVTLR